MIKLPRFTIKNTQDRLAFQLSDGDHWGIFFLQSSDVEARAF